MHNIGVVATARKGWKPKIGGLRRVFNLPMPMLVDDPEPIVHKNN